MPVFRGYVRNLLFEAQSITKIHLKTLTATACFYLESVTRQLWVIHRPCQQFHVIVIFFLYHRTG